VVGLVLNLICFSTGISFLGKGPLSPEVDIPSISLRWRPTAPLGDLPGFPMLGLLCKTGGLCGVLRVSWEYSGVALI